MPPCLSSVECTKSNQLIRQSRVHNSSTQVCTVIGGSSRAKPGERLMGQLERRAEAISGSSTRRMLQTRFGSLRRGDKARGADDGAAGAAGGGDIRGVQLAGCFKHAVGHFHVLHTA
jgi:hypothetical protein